MNKYLGKTDIKYNFRTIPGRKYQVEFSTRISKTFFTTALEKSLVKLHANGNVDLDNYKSWAADERLTPKLLKKFKKHLDKIEAGIRKKKAAGFTMVTRKIPSNGATFTQEGDFIKIDILVEGEYSL